MALRRRLAHRRASFRENVGSAFDSLAAAKGRSGLTVLGVVIGVSTVMAMATIVSGVRDQIVSTIEIAGPTTFYVMKVLSQTPRQSAGPADVDSQSVPISRRRTRTSSRSCPRSNTRRSGVRSQNRIEYAGDAHEHRRHHRRRRGLSRDLRRRARRRPLVHEVRGAERRARSSCSTRDVAKQLFGAIQPIDKLVRIGGRPMRVIGIYQPDGEHLPAAGQADARRSFRIARWTTSSRSTRPTRCSSRSSRDRASRWRTRRRR